MTQQPTQQVSLNMNVIYLGDEAVNFRVDAVGGQRPLIDMKVTPAQAAVLGRALLAASAVCASAPPKPAPGSGVTDCHFPVQRWDTGVSNVNQQPVLVLTIPGGAKLVFQMPHQAAIECGTALKAEGDKGKVKTD